MRVIGGSARGRPLKAKLPSTVRPTTDYAREAIFSMLESRGGLYDLVVADLYCGSGAMGIEAMSRGAAKVYFIDSDPACLAAVKLNLEPLNFDAEAVFVRAMLPVWSAPHDLDLVLADPPTDRSTSRACCAASWPSASLSRTIVIWSRPKAGSLPKPSATALRS